MVLQLLEGHPQKVDEGDLHEREDSGLPTNVLKREKGYQCQKTVEHINYKWITKINTKMHKKAINGILILIASWKIFRVKFSLSY